MSKMLITFSEKVLDFFRTFHYTTHHQDNHQPKPSKMLKKLLDKIAERFKCNHHVNYGIDTINSFDKEMLASSIVSLQMEGVTCSEIRKSLNGYYYFQIIPNNR